MLESYQYKGFYPQPPIGQDREHLTIPDFRCSFQPEIKKAIISLKG